MAQPGVRPHQLDEDDDGWPEGNGNVERPGMGEEKLDNSVYYIRGCTTSPTWRGPPARPRAPTRPRQRADGLAARFEDAWWIEADQQYADSLKRSAAT